MNNDKVIPINSRLMAQHTEKAYFKYGRATTAARYEKLISDTAMALRRAVADALDDAGYGELEIQGMFSCANMLRNKHDHEARNYGPAIAEAALKKITSEFMQDEFLLPITNEHTRTQKQRDILAAKRKAAAVEARILAAALFSELDMEPAEIGLLFDAAADNYIANNK
ncbi:MAG: hypothetical protein K6G84_05945 [Lachnospiraceae bacterium]|nr:hypothetical protein [Lachnospiraceae bacterium]